MSGDNKALSDAIERLRETGELDPWSPAYGVALYAIQNGYRGLTTAQRGLFDRELAPALERQGFVVSEMKPAQEKRRDA